MKLWVGRDVANKFLVVFAVLPSSSLWDTIEDLWVPSKTDYESFPALRSEVLVFLGDNWDEDVAAVLAIGSSPAKLHLVLVNRSSSELDRSVEPLVQVSVRPWRVHKLLLLELIHGLIHGSLPWPIFPA